MHFENVIGMKSLTSFCCWRMRLYVHKVNRKTIWEKIEINLFLKMFLSKLVSHIIFNTLKLLYSQYITGIMISDFFVINFHQSFQLAKIISKIFRQVIVWQCEQFWYIKYDVRNQLWSEYLEKTVYFNFSRSNFLLTFGAHIGDLFEVNEVTIFMPMILISYANGFDIIIRVLENNFNLNIFKNQLPIANMTTKKQQKITSEIFKYIHFFKYSDQSWILTSYLIHYNYLDSQIFTGLNIFEIIFHQILVCTFCLNWMRSKILRRLNFVDANNFARFKYELKIQNSTHFGARVYQ